MVECPSCGYPGPDFNRCPNCKGAIMPWTKATFDLHRHPNNFTFEGCEACDKWREENGDSDTEDSEDKDGNVSAKCLKCGFLNRVSNRWEKLKCQKCTSKVQHVKVLA